jgi:DNA repair protein SbcC/Rad50
VKRSLIFRQIGVRRMPGFPGGGPRLDELSPGINLVHGPNASGKTTTAMALQALLWPRTAPEAAGLEGRFELGAESWRVDVEARRASWQRDGQDAPPPPLPPADDRDRYFLSLHGLLRDDDRDLAERIRVESAGGYDVRRAGESLDFGAGGRPTSALGRLAAARAALAEAREREAALREESARLSRLREEQAVLRAAADRQEPLRRALALARADARVAEAEAVLATFPPELGLFRGDELERLDEWASAHGSCVRDESAAEADARRAAAELEATGLGEAGVAASLLADVEARLDEIRRLDDEIARARDAVADARGRRQEAGRALGIDPAESPRLLPSHADADGLDRFLQRVEALREKRAALEARLRVLADPAGQDATTDATTDDPARVEAAIPVLRRWLRTPEGGGVAERRLRALVLSGALTLVSAGLVLAVAGAAVLGALWVAGLGVVLALVAAALLVLRPAPEADGRSSLQREAERLGHRPGRWVSDDVERLLDELERRHAAERAAAERRLEADRVRADLDGLAVEEMALEAERAELATRLGLEPPPEPLALHVLATRLRAWDDSRRKEAAAGEQLRETTARRVEAIAGAAELLQPHGYDALDAPAVEAGLKDLRDRREWHQAAAARLERSRAERDRARREAESLERRRLQLLGDLGLPPDGEAALRDRADRLEAYRRSRSDLELAERERSVAAASLDEATRGAGVAGAGAGPDVLPARTVPGLERAVAEAAEASASERRLAETIAGIEARLETARQKHDVEEALAAVAEAESDLAERRDRDVEAEVGRRWWSGWASRDRDRNRPAVFHRARELFGLITRAVPPGPGGGRHSGVPGVRHHHAPGSRAGRAVVRGRGSSCCWPCAWRSWKPRRPARRSRCCWTRSWPTATTSGPPPSSTPPWPSPGTAARSSTSPPRPTSW